MCEPTTGAITTASVIGWASAAATASSLVIQQQNANAQEESNRRQQLATLDAQAQNSNQINLARNQQAELAGQKINSNNMAAREAQATAVASAGPSGMSVDALLGSVSQKAATYNESVNANYERVNLALDSQLVNVNHSAASEINSLKTPAQPDYLGAALRIGTDTYKNYTPPPLPKTAAT